MKATKYIIGALAILLMAGSCKKNENTEATDFSASIEIDDSGKTELYDNTKVRWTQSDVIRVFGGTANDQKDYTLKSGFEHTQHGEFSCGSGGVKEGNNYWGFYPASLNPSRSGENISFTMPATQTAMNGGFATNLNPMAARVTDGSTLLPFKNLFGLLKIELTTNTTITKVELIDEHNALSGTFTVDASTLNSTLGGFNNMTITKPAVSATNKTLTLNCSASSGAVLYFVIPPGALSQGFTVNFYRGTNGSSLVETQTVSSDQTIHSNQIKKMQVTANATLPQVKNILPIMTNSNWTIKNLTLRNGNYDAQADIQRTYGNHTYYSGDPLGKAIAVTTLASTGEGTYSCEIPDADIVTGHTYYLRWWTQMQGNNPTNLLDAYFPVAEPRRASQLTGGYYWQMNSVTFTLQDGPYILPNINNLYISNHFDGYNKIRFDINNDKKAFNACMAAPMLIDLTKAFTENGITIPNLDGLPYFSGTINIDDWHW